MVSQATIMPCGAKVRVESQLICPYPPHLRSVPTYHNLLATYPGSMHDTLTPLGCSSRRHVSLMLSTAYLVVE